MILVPLEYFAPEKTNTQIGDDDGKRLALFQRLCAQCLPAKILVQSVLQTVVPPSSENFQSSLVDLLVAECDRLPVLYYRAVAKFLMQYFEAAGGVELDDRLIELAAPKAPGNPKHTYFKYYLIPSYDKPLDMNSALDMNWNDFLLLRFPGEFVLSNTGLAQWDAGLVLTEYLIHHGRDGVLVSDESLFSVKLASPRDKLVVLELGAGLGLASLALARKCASSVTAVLTDGNADVCENLEHNVAVNQLDSVCKVVLFNWSRFLANDDEPFQCDAMFKVPEINAIIAADVCYDPELVPVFLSCLAKLFLALPNVSHCLLALTKRSEETFQVFLRALDKFNLHIADTLATSNYPRLFYCQHRDQVSLYIIKPK